MCSRVPGFLHCCRACEELQAAQAGMILTSEQKELIFSLAGGMPRLLFRYCAELADQAPAVRKSVNVELFSM